MRSNLRITFTTLFTSLAIFQSLRKPAPKRSRNSRRQKPPHSHQKSRLTANEFSSKLKNGSSIIPTVFIRYSEASTPEVDSLLGEAIASTTATAHSGLLPACGRSETTNSPRSPQSLQVTQTAGSISRRKAAGWMPLRLRITESVLRRRNVIARSPALPSGRRFDVWGWRGGTA